MNRFVLYIIFSGIFFPVSGQGNLVYNGSFEEYSECPTGNDLNNGQLEKATGWWKPTFGTSDYFNRCNNNYIVDVPTNFWGSQEPFQGDAYVGLVPVEWTLGGETVAFEYIQCKLLSPLKPCFKYRFKMYISCANKSQYAVGKIGAYFSELTINSTNTFNLEAIPQITSQVIINDTVNWYPIEGDFIAKGNEEFLTIGYFEPSIYGDTLFIQEPPVSIGTRAGYYYIDSISLYEIGEAYSMCDTISLPNIFTPNNDGVNDQIDISQFLHMEPQVMIYNRWGNHVVTLSKAKPYWNGMINNLACSNGVYFYIISYASSKKKQSGSIHLTR